MWKAKSKVLMDIQNQAFKIGVNDSYQIYIKSHATAEVQYPQEFYALSKAEVLDIIQGYYCVNDSWLNYRKEVTAYMGGKLSENIISDRIVLSQTVPKKYIYESIKKQMVAFYEKENESLYCNVLNVIEKQLSYRYIMLRYEAVRLAHSVEYNNHKSKFDNIIEMILDEFMDPHLEFFFDYQLWNISNSIYRDMLFKYMRKYSYPGESKNTFQTKDQNILFTHKLIKEKLKAVYIGSTNRPPDGESSDRPPAGK